MLRPVLPCDSSRTLGCTAMRGSASPTCASSMRTTCRFRGDRSRSPRPCRRSPSRWLLVAGGTEQSPSSSIAARFVRSSIGSSWRSRTGRSSVGSRCRDRDGSGRVVRDAVDDADLRRAWSRGCAQHDRGVPGDRLPLLARPGEWGLRYHGSQCCSRSRATAARARRRGNAEPRGRATDRSSARSRLPEGPGRRRSHPFEHAPLRPHRSRRRLERRDELLPAGDGADREVPGSRPLEVAVNARHRFLRVTIENGDDLPLESLRVIPEAMSRPLLLAGGHRPPFRLLYGAAGLAAPAYDFAQLPPAATGFERAVEGTLARSVSTRSSSPPRTRRPSSSATTT